MASFEKEEMEEKESGDGHVLTRYLIVVLLLLPVVIGILFFTFKICFCRKRPMEQGGREPEKTQSVGEP